MITGNVKRFMVTVAYADGNSGYGLHKKKLDESITCLSRLPPDNIATFVNPDQFIFRKNF